VHVPLLNRFVRKESNMEGSAADDIFDIHIPAIDIATIHIAAINILVHIVAIDCKVQEGKHLFIGDR
jgi:hypothetical protein